LKKKKPEKNKVWASLPAGNTGFFTVFLIQFLFFFCPVKTSAQSPDYPFKSGEYARYGAYYNWHFIWIQSGEVEFNANTVVSYGQSAWSLSAIGKTFKAYDLLFAVRDTFKTLCNFNTFDLIYSRRAIHHGKENSVHQYWSIPDQQKIKIETSTQNKLAYQGTIGQEPDTYDLLSTAYSFRKFDFNKLFIGQKVPYRMIIDQKVDELYFHYLGREKIKTRTGQEFLCHKVSVYLLQGDFFPEGEYMKIWFTDDKNHLPVQVESEIMVGSVKAVLIEANSLKYPLNSQIK